MEASLVWAIALVALGLLLLAFEAFIPSGGILGVLSAAALMAGITMCFYTNGLRTGTAFLGGTLAAVAVTVALLVRWWPYTTLGRLILNNPPTADEVAPDLSPLRNAVGRHGKAKSLMLPGGLVEIDGVSFDAVTESGVVEKGEWVEVVAIRGRNLVVRPVGAEIVRKLETTAGADDLAQPIDEITPDPFADPLA